MLATGVVAKQEVGVETETLGQQNLKNQSITDRDQEQEVRVGKKKEEYHLHQYLEHKHMKHQSNQP